jgi:hydrogenase nickel incorporation protein HypB
LEPLGLRLLAHNDRQAEVNRRHFDAAGVRVMNILSSPGSGKTALLEALARHGAASSLALAALVGDLATDHDAARLRAAGLEAVAITTGQACHLDAAMVARGVEALEAGGRPLAALDLLLIENVGNLVCPAAYDLGEHQRLVLLAVGEGEDKPLKYPATFHSADVVVISKSDLAAAVGFERERALAHLDAVAPGAAIVEVSSLHHSHVVTIRGDSYRLREKRRSGLFRPQAGGSSSSGIGGTPPPTPAKEA